MHVMGGLGDVGGWVDPAMKKKPVNQTFLENDNNSKISSIDFLQTPVSTGLGLSLNYRRVAGPSTMESPPFSVFGDEIELEIQRQDAQLSCFLQHQVLPISLTQTQYLFLTIGCIIVCILFFFLLIFLV